MKPLPRLLLLVSLSGLVLSSTSHASNLGNDNAANYASSGWPSDNNGGTGFNAWTFSRGDDKGNGASGYFLGNSTTLSGGNNGANINSANGASFGLYANSSGGNNGNVYANAIRSFAGGSLVIGQKFSLDLAVNYRNGNKGIDLQDAGGNVIFTFNVGGDDYTVSHAADGNGSIGNSYSSNLSFHLDFSQVSDTSGTWAITRSVGGVASSSISGAYTGDAAGFQLYVVGTNQGDENNFFANNLDITGVPEPATWLGGALVLSIAGCQLQRLRTRRAFFVT